MNHWLNWHAQLHQTLKTRSLLPAQSRILIAVSGGQDSIGLLRLLLDLRHHWDWQLGVIHCNHQWRSDANANADHVRSHCESWGIACQVATAAHPPSSEAAARNWRYLCFEQQAIAEHYAYVVTGHTATDRAETLLYNLVRGSGSDGLQALGWSRAISAAAPIQLVRPLLALTREDTAQLCEDLQLPIWVDSTNHDRTYARNRLRLDVLPYLHQHLNPRSTQHLAQTAELLSAEVEYLEAQALVIYQQAIDPQQPCQIDRLILRSSPLALQRRVIRRFLQQELPQSPNFDPIEAVVGLIDAPNRCQTSTFSGGLGVRVRDRYLELFRKPPTGPGALGH